MALRRAVALKWETEIRYGSAKPSGMEMETASGEPGICKNLGVKGELKNTIDHLAT